MYGGPTGALYPTVLYRTHFNVPSAAAIQSLKINLMRDDGAIIFLNGTQVVVDGVSTPYTFGATATQTVGGTDETTYFTHAIPATALVEGENVIAVEIHQAAVTSSDIRFDLELRASTQPSGPPSGATIVITEPKDGQTFREPADVAANKASPGAGAATL